MKHATYKILKYRNKLNPSEEYLSSTFWLNQTKMIEGVEFVLVSKKLTDTPKFMRKDALEIVK